MTLWPAPPVTRSLPPGEVHLWRIPLTISSEEISLLHTLLCADEWQRAKRLLDRRKAQDFIVGRGRLRQILASYLHSDPVAIEFTCGMHGKPALTSNALQFNLSHSGAWAVLALRADAAVGVDLERIDPALDYAALAARFFTSAENELLLAAPTAQRRRRFYRLWTRKEALLKGQGRGFSVSAEQEAGDWRLQSFWIAPGYVGTVACAGEIPTLRRWQATEEK
ncbi:MAG: 4'-phosphopantetheinyl transferase [Deltaproteobacteria bacterium HGW-Deltaproteobacteria-4]|nr:MAG: 4'-phosphopantetheinyl transferase [Deltaproteobacteria bacterium HGW-Deltaproteobacteria-4]